MIMIMFADDRWIVRMGVMFITMVMTVFMFEQ